MVVRLLLVGLFCSLTALPVAAAELKPKTVKAFEAYVTAAEAEMQAELDPEAPFVWLAGSEAARTRLRNGEILIERRKEGTDVPDGLLHDWTGTMLIEGATLEDVVGVLTSFSRHKEIYPEVQESKLLEEGPNTARTFLRLKRKKVVTVVYNTEYDVRYSRPSQRRWQSRSHSTRIAQVEDAGEPDEKERPIGDDSGYLWRLNAYWRVEQLDDGVLVACRAISLSRGIPFGLGWLVGPFVNSVPRESLVSTLEATRKEVG